MKQHDVEQAKCIRIDNVTSSCKKQHNDYMNENSFDDYISFSFYIDDIERGELIEETILSLNEISTDSLKNEEKF